MKTQLDLISFSYSPHCKRCGSGLVVRNGKYKKHERIYLCKRCGCQSVFGSSDIYRMRKPSEMIAEALGMYASLGISLRSIGRKLKVAHTTVARWVKKLASRIPTKMHPAYTMTWRFDETYVRINKKWWWLSVVLCDTTRLVLSWGLREEEHAEDIVHILKQAIENAGFRPREVITDGYFHYPWKIKKAFGWRFVKHRVEKGLGHNQKIERHFREVKRRIKWFSSFRTRESAESFFSVFFFVYNYLKPHRGIGWQTPAQKAGVPAETLEGLLKPSIPS